jgi:hypothetical protein
MARVTYSPLVTGVSGKVKDTVFSRWKGRAYIRARVTPSNPQTVAQTAVRTSLARCVDLWQSFQTQIKAAWDLYASPYSMSGYNKFVSANRADEQAGNELQTSPLNSLVDPADTFSAASGSGSGEIDLTWTGGTVGAAYKAYVLVRVSGSDAFALADADTTLFSDGAYTITGLTPAATYQVYLTDEETAENLFSESMSDEAVALA